MIDELERIQKETVGGLIEALSRLVIVGTCGTWISGVSAEEIRTRYPQCACPQCYL
jgi:hypothetical protein